VEKCLGLGSRDSTETSSTIENFAGLADWTITANANRFGLAAASEHSP
jgi:hypothetical protein